MQHYHSSIRWKHIWQVHRHQELKIVLFFFEQQLKIMLLLWTYGPGSSIGPELLGREEEVASGHGDGTGGRSTRKRNSES